MAQYIKFGKKQFEYELRGILIKNKIGFLYDITEEWFEEGNFSKEYIYKIKTKNKNVDIIIFSSIDIKTGYVRNIGSDAVRIVLRWKTENGYVFSKLAKHYRIKTLFDNLESTLVKCAKTSISNFYVLDKV